jgi:hypothetical protein
LFLFKVIDVELVDDVKVSIVDQGFENSLTNGVSTLCV